MQALTNLIFYAVRWSARHGLREDSPAESSALASEQRKQSDRLTGVRGETYGYWYLRRQGYVFVAKNYIPHGAKGELDLVGYDGKTLAIVEIRTRTVREKQCALPELSVTYSKQAALVRTARRYLAERHLHDCPCRFDVLAIDNIPGQRPAVRLHKDAFSPQLH
jgi:putative endonuclease